MRNNTVRRRSHENLFHCRPASAVWAALIVPLFATITALPAAAQIIAAPGQSVTVLPNTTITCTDCVALLTQGPPGGMITAPGLFTLNVNSTGLFTAGANVLPNTGGEIHLNSGTINNTTNAGGIGATGVLSQSGLITGTNVNINGSGFQSSALEAQSGGQIT